MLDGEDAPGERATAEVHLAGCRECRMWWEAASVVTRLGRTGPASTGPAVPDSVLDAAPGPARARLATGLRAVLGGLGAIQLGLGLVQVTGFAQGTILHDGHLSAATTTDHLWHESAAWNVAVGAGFLWVALRRYRPAGVLPMLTAFVAVLVLLSTTDLLAGRVETGRLVSHAFIITGYAVIVVLTRPGFDFGEPPVGPGHGSSGWRARFDTDNQTAATPTRMARPIEGTAQYRRAA